MNEWTEHSCFQDCITLNCKSHNMSTRKPELQQQFGSIEDAVNIVYTLLPKNVIEFLKYWRVSIHILTQTPCSQENTSHSISITLPRDANNDAACHNAK